MLDVLKELVVVVFWCPTDRHSVLIIVSFLSLGRFSYSSSSDKEVKIVTERQTDS